MTNTLFSLVVLLSTSTSALIPPTGSGINNKIDIPNGIGFSTAHWGDGNSNFVTSDKISKKQARAGKFTSRDCKVAFKTLLDGGISFVDTSPYFGGSAEQIVAEAVSENWKNTPLISTKYRPSVLPFLNSSGSVVKSLKKSLERLDASYVDLYQVDFRKIAIGSRSSIADGLASCMDRGLCTNVGVCNMGPGGLETMYDRLSDLDVDLATNSVEFSLVNRGALFDGTLEACEELGILPLARNPLGDDLASGVYTASNPTGGKLRKAQYDFKVLGPLKPLHDALAKVRKTARDRFFDEFYERKEANNRNYKVAPITGDFEREVTTTQIALLYVKAKGCVPIVDIDNKKEAIELLGCISENNLTQQEVKILDKAAEQCGR